MVDLPLLLPCYYFERHLTSNCPGDVAAARNCRFRKNC
jgi:hypothetical protein